LYRIPFKVTVFDEAHALKNPKNNRYQRLLKVQTQRRLLLSGTPIQNNVQELLALLVFCFPAIFSDSHLDFGEIVKEDPERFRRVLAPFILRRVKADVLAHLAPKTEEVVFLDMLPNQYAEYQKLVKELGKQDKFVWVFF